MSTFVPRWSCWSADQAKPREEAAAETRNHGDSKTSKPSKSPFAGSAGALGERLEQAGTSQDGLEVPGGGAVPASGESENKGEIEVKTRREGASKPSKSPFAGSADSLEHRLEIRAARGPVNPDAAEIAGLDLQTFAQAGLILRIHSEVLGQDVLFVSDNVPEAAIAHRGLTVYRARELRKLAILGPSPRSLKTIHDAKTIFDGVITDV